MIKIRQAAIALMPVLVLGCGSSDPDTFIDIDGRLERSATVVMSVFIKGEPVPDSAVVWAADPPSAVTFDSDGAATFLAAGLVRLSAQTPGKIVVRDVEIAVPPTIVFDLLRDGNRDIYRVALDGQDLVRLTTDPADDGDPTSVGDTVIFVSFRDGNGELYQISLGGSTPQRLTSTAELESTPALSRDGASLAYSRSENGVAKLWVRSMELGTVARVTGSFGFPGSIETSPSWSSDDGEIAFVSTSEGTADVFSYTVSDTSFALLVPDSAESADVEPAWSPDGTWIAFASNRTGETEIYAYERASGTNAQLTDRPDTDGRPAWLDDGRLVYVEWTSGTPKLRWLDPSEPEAVYDIDVGPGEPDNPSGVAGEGGND